MLGLLLFSFVDFEFGILLILDQPILLRIPEVHNFMRLYATAPSFTLFIISLVGLFLFFFFFDLKFFGLDSLRRSVRVRFDHALFCFWLEFQRLSRVWGA